MTTQNDDADRVTDDMPPGDIPVVSIIVVSFNTSKMTRACIASVIAETTVPYELIVIDNASADGSAADIAADFPDIRLMAETENHGFAAANNIAAREARGEYILLLNPDTVVLDHAIDKLVGFAVSRPEAKIWGGRTLFGDRSLNPTSAYQKMSVWNLFCRLTGLGPLLGHRAAVSEAYGGWQFDEERRVDIVTGCFLLIPRTLWAALDGFHPAYFMYGEEADLCLRATRDHGARPAITPAAEIVHYGGASETVRADRQVRLFAAKMTLIRHHFDGWRRPVGAALFAAIPLSRAWALTVLGAISGRAGWKASAAIWAEIWARRAEWRHGFRM